jgi:hypothetical protein
MSKKEEHPLKSSRPASQTQNKIAHIEEKT